MLNASFEEVRELVDYRELIYTGPVDAFFGYRYGKLPYRSLACSSTKRTPKKPFNPAHRS